MALSAKSKRIIGIVLLVLLAATFFFSAYTKLIAINSFQWSFIDLGFTPYLAAIAARVMVGIEFLIGGLLLFHVYLKSFTYPLTWVVLLVFSIYLLITILVRGNDGNCGCFGDEFYMTPLEGLLKNVGLMVIVWILNKLYPGPNFSQQMILGTMIVMASFATVFVALPMTQKPEPIALKHLYKPTQKEIPAIDLQKGKHIIAFMSLTCPHCVKAATQMEKLYQADKSLPFYAVLNGDSTDEKEFYDVTGLSFPHSKFKGPEEFLEMAGPGVPAIYYVQDGVKLREINYMELNEAAIKSWMNK